MVKSKEILSQSFEMEVLQEHFARNKIAYHMCGNGNSIRKPNGVNPLSGSVIEIFPTRDKKGIGNSPWVSPFEINPFTCCWKLRVLGKPRIEKIDLK